MKNFFVLFICICVSLQTIAQKLKDFQEAMKTPREFGKGYILTKRYKDEKVRQFASENGFKVVGVNYKGFVMFVPLDEYDTYKFEINGYDYINSFTQGYARSMDLGASVSTSVKHDLEHYVAISESERVNKNLRGIDFKARGSAYLYGNDRFFKFDQVFWTGEVKNGMIDGRGDGFVVTKNEAGENVYHSFSGGFKNGLPYGDVIIARGFPNDGRGWNSYFKVSKEKIEVGHISDGLAKYRIFTGSSRNIPLYGYVDERGNITIKPSYKEAKDFNNGIAYVTPDKTEVKIDKTGRVFGLSENAKMSFDEMIKMKEQYPQLLVSIEAHASKYVEEELSFNELVRVEKVFPNLSQKITPYKLTIYKKDYQQLQKVYQAVLVSANANKADKQGSQFVSTFIRQYSSYDPDQKVSMARELAAYYTVCDAMEISVRNSYWNHDSYNPSFYYDGNEHKSTLSKAKEICSSAANSKFKGFYTFALPGIKAKFDDISYKLARDSHEYESAYSQYLAEKRMKEAEYENKRAQLENINETSVFLYVKRQDENWSGGRFFDTDDNYDDTKKVIFVEIDNPSSTFTGVIHKRRRGSQICYYSSGGTYTTYQDAVCGEYLDHYNRSWNHHKY